MNRTTVGYRFAPGCRRRAVLAIAVALATAGWASAAPVPYMTIEGNPVQGERLGSTDVPGQASFVYSQPWMPIEYRYLPSLTLKDANGNAAAFPQWAKLLIKDEALVDWIGAGNKVQGGTQVMSATIAAGQTGRFFDPQGERASFGQVYPFGVAFQPVDADAFANITFRFEDFGDARIDALLQDNAWPGKPGGIWQPWSTRTAGLEKDADGALTGRDAAGNPVAQPLDGLYGVWIPSQIVQQNRVLLNRAHDLASDTILFNSRVRWNKTTDAPAAKQVDFYHVALHEVGHGLGLDHAVPEPGALWLTAIALWALAAGGLPRRRSPGRRTP